MCTVASCIFGVAKSGDDEMSELALLGQMILCLEKLAEGEGCC